ncbi:MAG: MopE-related protein [Bacteroidota bacterium]
MGSSFFFWLTKKSRRPGRLVVASLLLANLFILGHRLQAQNHSVARIWNEALLESIRQDFARPTVHARNLWHSSIAMYDAWAVFDSVAQPYFLGQTIDGYTCPFNGFTTTVPKEIAVPTVIFHAMYRLLRHRFQYSPGAGNAFSRFNNLMVQNGYNLLDTTTNYSNGSPASLGNYLGKMLINFGMQDGANEVTNYGNASYLPVNLPLVTNFPGNPSISDPNRWQPLTLSVFIDQSGNVIPYNTPPFLSPEWGQVTPFALDTADRTTYTRSNFDYQVYHDPGAPPYLDTTGVDPLSDEYKWGFTLVSVWGAHLDPADSVMWDISPNSIGNIQSYPTTIQGLQGFYDLLNGGDPSIGHSVNPHTGQPYEPQMVPRGDYARVLAEFWADGPDSETPPGHWFTILNYVSDEIGVDKRYNGQGPILSELEWDVKSYFTLGGAVHDAAISAWGIKGWYDYIRPISAIRCMAELGQCSDSTLPNYHPGGIPLIPGYIELVQAGDSLDGGGDNLNKIKVYTWKGHPYINNTATDAAGVGWILAENWWPYQRPTFVTPNFAGYVSGHSTFSRAAAEVLTYITGDPFFPGGMGEFQVDKNQFLVFEEGPSVDFTLQWATYRDASDQTSLSRIWGGIHPPVDDIPGRLIGEKVGIAAYQLAETYFYQDLDQDGYFNYVDCNDQDSTVYPGAQEICDGKDNDCNGVIDDDLFLFSYFRDRDGDGYGDPNSPLDTCAIPAPPGYVTNNMDCQDLDSTVHPNAQEVCNGIDNNCNGQIDDGLIINRYWLDEDQDGFGNPLIFLDTCLQQPPLGYASNGNDCADDQPDINPLASEICDGIDNDCQGGIDDGLTLYAYFLDADGDSYGDAAIRMDTCLAEPPLGFVTDSSDCNDSDDRINPGRQDFPDNGVDEDCLNGDLIQLHRIFPNPVRDKLTIHYQTDGSRIAEIFSHDGRLLISEEITFEFNKATLDLTTLPDGMYTLRIFDPVREIFFDRMLMKQK